VTKVSEKILADARAEAERIETEAREQTGQLLQQVDQEVADRQAQLDGDIQRAAEAERLQLLARARMKSRLAELGVRQEAIGSVFERAAEALRSLPDGQYRTLIVNWMLAAVETGEERVVVGTDETRIDHALVSEVNKRLSEKLDKEGRLSLADERRPIGAGFILVGQRTEVNASLAVMLAAARNELEPELARVLFGENG